MSTPFPVILTSGLTRDALAELSKSPRTRKALENLLTDTSQNLPNAVIVLMGNFEDLDAALTVTNGRVAQAVALAAQALGRGVDEPIGMAQLRARVTALEKQVADFQSGHRPL